MCGMYASNGILAALHHRNKTGEGQHIDLALADSQVAWLVNVGTDYLASGKPPKRAGNAHANIVPYQVYATRDGFVIVAVGNNGQFRSFCQAMQLEELLDDPRFATNPERVANREAINAIIEPALKMQTTDQIVTRLEAVGVPVGPVNSVEQVFASDQVKAREMQVDIPLAKDPNSVARVIGNPLKFSKTPVSYRHAPPQCGEHSDAIRSEFPKQDNAARKDQN
jgi:crotonobetainyl-CoA:carnitine CoA-transferase CaiB-like acyl-CoA transferase